MVVLCEFNGGFMVVLFGSMWISCDLPSTELTLSTPNGGLEALWRKSLPSGAMVVKMRIATMREDDLPSGYVKIAIEHGHL